MEDNIKYKFFSEEAYQKLLRHVIKQVHIDVNDAAIKDSYRHAVAEKKYSLEYTGYDCVPVMDMIEQCVVSWAKVNASKDFFVSTGKHDWMVKDIVGSFTYTTNRLFVDMCDKYIGGLAPDKKGGEHENV